MHFSVEGMVSEQCQTLILQRLCVQFFTLDTALLSANGILVGLTFLSSRSGSNCSKTHKTFSSMCWWVNTRRWFCFHLGVLRDGSHPEHLTSNKEGTARTCSLLPFTKGQTRPAQKFSQIQNLSAFLRENDCYGMGCISCKQDLLASGDFHGRADLCLDILASFHASALIISAIMK